MGPVAVPRAAPSSKFAPGLRSRAGLWDLARSKLSQLRSHCKTPKAALQVCMSETFTFDDGRVCRMFTLKVLQGLLSVTLHSHVREPLLAR
jgi:hypothetical protein